MFNNFYKILNQLFNTEFIWKIGKFENLITPIPKAKFEKKKKSL